MRADSTTEAAVEAVLDRLARVYVERDVELLRAVFAADPDVVMFSPGAKARFVGISEIEAKAVGDWSTSESASLAYRRRSVSAAGAVAWAAVDADFTVNADGEERTLPAHITFVLERRGDEWSIVHAHYSFA
ncbi:MAG TPA: nuclear transport factor 2 family protein [Gaiellaceae bacterium]|nr:nuclear transport factor 2 family protein [Gaiellaceae bacterium]